MSDTITSMNVFSNTEPTVTYTAIKDSGLTVTEPTIRSPVFKPPSFVISQGGHSKKMDELQEIIGPSYKYAEGQIISDFKKYVDKTYDQHYKTEDKSIQCFDAWIALGEATPTFRNTALKYLWRYGKKNGNDKNDLMKVLHYTLMCLYNDHYRDGK